MGRNNSASAVVEVDSKAGWGIAADPEHGWLGILMAVHSSESWPDPAGSVKRHLGIGERRKNHMVASSVQQTEGFEDIDTWSTEWCLMAKGNLADMNARRHLEMYSRGVYLPFVPCLGPILPQCGSYQLTEKNSDRLPLLVVALDYRLCVRIVHLASCLIGVSREPS